VYELSTIDSTLQLDVGVISILSVFGLKWGKIFLSKKKSGPMCTKYDMKFKKNKFHIFSSPC